MSRKKLLLIIAVSATTWLSVSPAQKATERYIPLGESPGISENESIVGTIATVDYETMSVQIRNGGKSKTVRMSDTTRYYLDRSKSRLPNRLGTIYDCKVGLLVEVKYLADSTVDWIKIQSP